MSYTANLIIKKLRLAQSASNDAWLGWNWDRDRISLYVDEKKVETWEVKGITSSCLEQAQVAIN